MQEEPEYITINEMIERDLNKKMVDNSKPKQPVYQAQAKLGENSIQLVNVGEYNFIPTTKILELTNGKHFCKLLSMVITHDEIDKDIKHFISFFISKKKSKILCRLSYSYITTEQKFCVCLEKAKNVEIIEKYNEYCGNAESIYLLTDILLRKDVKKKIFG